LIYQILLLQDLTAMDPLRERAQRILMPSRYASGDTVGALRIYESLRQAVLRQLDPTTLIEQLSEELHRHADADPLGERR
jgi:DNA-binding SARP family transcriptional activator